MLTKDSFLLTHLFLCYQTLKNTENYLYTMFSIETNGAVVESREKRRKKKKEDGDNRYMCVVEKNQEKRKIKKKIKRKGNVWMIERKKERKNTI